MSPETATRDRGGPLPASLSPYRARRLFSFPRPDKNGPGTQYAARPAFVADLTVEEPSIGNAILFSAARVQPSEQSRRSLSVSFVLRRSLFHGQQKSMEQRAACVEKLGIRSVK